MALRPIPITQRTKNTLNVANPVVKNTNMNGAPTSVPLPVYPKTMPATPVKNLNQNFGMGSAEGGAVKPKPTLATRDNPMISVSTVPTPVDVNTADQNTLLKEQDAINYKISTGSFSQEDFVRGREISRKLAESLYKAPEQVVNPYLTQLEEQASKVSARDNNPLVDARRVQLQANLDTRRAQLEENARRARESTIGNIAMAGGGRSSVAQQAELDIQRQLQNQLNAEQAAMNLEIMAYERELAGADSKELEGINQSINALRTQAAQGQQALQTQSQSKIMEATAQFDTNLQNLARSRGIELDINDEKAIEQFITIARNPDGTVNETFLKTLSPQYQELVRAGVGSGIGRSAMPAPKIERLGGTTKNPVYGYRDGTKFVTTNAMGVPTGGVRTGGGGSGGVGTGGGGGSLSQNIISSGATAQSLGISENAMNVIKQMNLNGGSIDDYIKGQSKESQNLRNEVWKGLNAQGGSTTKEVDVLNEALGVVQQMKDSNDYKEFGYSSKYGGQFLSSYGDMKLRADQINAILTKDNLGLMKGVLSESDMSMLKAMSGGLLEGGVISEKVAKEKIDSIYNKINKRIQDRTLKGSTPTAPSGATPTTTTTTPTVSGVQRRRQPK